MHATVLERGSTANRRQWQKFWKVFGREGKRLDTQDQSRQTVNYSQHKPYARLLADAGHTLKVPECRLTCTNMHATTFRQVYGTRKGVGRKVWGCIGVPG